MMEPATPVSPPHVTVDPAQLEAWILGAVQRELANFASSNGFQYHPTRSQERGEEQAEPPRKRRAARRSQPQPTQGETTIPSSEVVLDCAPPLSTEQPVVDMAGEATPDPESGSAVRIRDCRVVLPRLVLPTPGTSSTKVPASNRCSGSSSSRVSKGTEPGTRSVPVSYVLTFKLFAAVQCGILNSGINSINSDEWVVRVKQI